MLTWKIWLGSGEQWDAVIAGFGEHSVYQSSSWGRHRSQFGWDPVRLVGYDNGTICSAVQLLVKRLPFRFGVVWIPGGPSGDVAQWADTLPTAIFSLAGLRYGYCRMNSSRMYSSRDDELLSVSGWHCSSRPMLSGLSMHYGLNGSEGERFSRLRKSWRHNLRRSQNKGLSVFRWHTPDPEEMMAVYSSMQEYKGLRGQTTATEIMSLLTSFGQRCLIVRCDDEAGNLIAVRGALVQRDRAWDVIAAATVEGRRSYASYAAFWELMRLCEQEGVTWYDMGGIDPLKSKGVYDFKKGTGANELKYLGEWEIGFPSLLRWFVGKAIAWRFRL